MAAMPLHEFADKLNTLSTLIMKEFGRRFQDQIYKGKITLPQFIILKFLEDNGSACMTELARFMNVTTAAMTGIVARLVRAGYVRRETGVKDRRIIRIVPTAKGEDLISKIHEERRKIYIDIFGRIPENDREEYLRILNTLKDTLGRRDKDVK